MAPGIARMAVVALRLQALPMPSLRWMARVVAMDGSERGPIANPRDSAGELFLQIILPEEKFLDCRRRQAPGA